jgi:hypothetical protein
MVFKDHDVLRTEDLLFILMLFSLFNLLVSSLVTHRHCAANLKKLFLIRDLSLIS